jgi:hypothetical protein
MLSHPLAGVDAFLYFVQARMGNLWRVLEWAGLCLGAVTSAFAVTFGIARRRILRHVQGELGQDVLLLSTAARMGGYEGSRERGRPSLAIGILMLLSSGLYFHAWSGRREVFIPGAAISWIGVPERREDSGWKGQRIVVRFLNASGKQDGVAIRLLYPEQWVDAIKTHLIARA